MGTLRSLGALARALGPTVAASGKSRGTALVLPGAGLPRLPTSAPARRVPAMSRPHRSVLPPRG